MLFPQGIPTEDLHRVFTKQIGQSFVDILAGKENTSATRSRAYCQLVKMYPEGLFKGFSFPNLAAKEDYTLQVLSGKRGEAASISVAESENANSDEEELDLGSEADSEEDSVPVADSESLVVFPYGIRMNPVLYVILEYSSLLPEPHSRHTGVQTQGESPQRGQGFSAEEVSTSYHCSPGQGRANHLNCNPRGRRIFVATLSNGFLADSWPFLAVTGRWNSRRQNSSCKRPTLSPCPAPADTCSARSPEGRCQDLWCHFASQGETKEKPANHSGTHG